MQTINEEKLNKDIDKIVAKVHMLQKKKRLWGLSEEENNELSKLLFTYMKNHYQLIDVVFSNYVEPFLYNDKIVYIKSVLTSKYDWDGSLLFFDNDMEKLFNKINDKQDNKQEVLDLINELVEEELVMSADFEDSDYGQEIIELFGTLQNTTSPDCIENYIRLRNDIITTMIMEVE